MSDITGTEAQELFDSATEITFIQDGGQKSTGIFATGRERFLYKILVLADQDFRSVLVRPPLLAPDILYFTRLLRADAVVNPQGTTISAAALISGFPGGSPVAHGAGGGASAPIQNFTKDRYYIYAIVTLDQKVVTEPFEFWVEKVP